MSNLPELQKSKNAAKMSVYFKEINLSQLCPLLFYPHGSSYWVSGMIFVFAKDKLSFGSRFFM